MYQSNEQAGEKHRDAILLDSAIALIGELGLQRASTRDIAERAGISPATINYRYGSRAQLIEQALHHAAAASSAHWAGRWRFVAAQALQANDLAGLLSSVLSEDFVARRHLARLRWICLRETEKSGALRDVAQQWIEAPAQFWTRCIDGLGLAAVDGPLLAVGLMSMAQPYLHGELSWPVAAWMRDATDRLADRLLRRAPRRPGDSRWRQQLAAQSALLLPGSGFAPESTPGRIVQGAIDIARASGVASVSHRAIAARTGVSLSSTTYHFAHLEAILIEAAREVYRRARAAAMIHVERPSSMTMADLLASLHATLTGPGTQIRADSAVLSELMSGISRSEGVRPMALALLAQAGRTSTAMLRALEGVRADVDALDGHLFAHLLRAAFIESAVSGERDAAEGLAHRVTALVERLWR